MVRRKMTSNLYEVAQLRLIRLAICIYNSETIAADAGEGVGINGCRLASGYGCDYSVVPLEVVGQFH